MKRMALAAAAMLLAAVPMDAQTRVDARQLRTAPTPPTVVLLFRGGRAVLATLGPGIELDTSGAVPVLRIAQAQQPTESRLSKSGSAWALPSGCAKVVVWRNGLRQWPGDDYTIVSGSVVFRSGTDATDPSSADDVVVAECRPQ